MTVRQFLAVMNTALGGGLTGVVDFDALHPLVQDVSAAFDGGSVSPFASQHLVDGACPGAWTNGDLVTYNQQSWGSIGTPASDLLTTYFDALYPNGLQIGIAGNGGNSALFTTVDAVLSFLPASEDPAPLENDVLDPSSTVAGTLASYVLALKLDVDFTNAGYLAGTATVRFGDLQVCGLASTPSYNGFTVQRVHTALEQALGGASVAYVYEQLSDLALQLTESFESGTPSQFAQDHLVNGTCP